MLKGGYVSPLVELDDARAIVLELKEHTCLLYTSDAADERSSVDLGGRRIIKKKNRKVLNDGAAINHKEHKTHIQHIQRNEHTHRKNDYI